MIWLIDKGDGNHKWGLFLIRKLPIPNARCGNREGKSLWLPREQFRSGFSNATAVNVTIQKRACGSANERS